MEQGKLRKKGLKQREREYIRREMGVKRKRKRTEKGRERRRWERWESERRG